MSVFACVVMSHKFIFCKALAGIISRQSSAKWTLQKIHSPLRREKAIGELRNASFKGSWRFFTRNAWWGFEGKHFNSELTLSFSLHDIYSPIINYARQSWKIRDELALINSKWTMGILVRWAKIDKEKRNSTQLSATNKNKL